MNKKTTSILTLALGILGVWWLMFDVRTDTSSTPTPVVSDQVKWSFDEVKENASGLPQIKVTVKVHGEKYDAGTYSGLCIERGKEELLEGQISGVLCYTAGFGDEVGIFKDGRDYTLQVGEVQEPSAEGPEFRGNFRVVTIIK
jgi:hypothetical protein